MGIELVKKYVLFCDHPGCNKRLVIDAEKWPDAMRKANRAGWTIGKALPNGGRTTSCIEHRYRTNYALLKDVEV